MKSGSVSLRHPGPRNPRSTNEYVPREVYRVIRARFARRARKAGRVSRIGNVQWLMFNVELPGLARRGDFEVFGTLNSELRTQNSELRVAPVVHILHVPLTIHERQGPDELGS